MSKNNNNNSKLFNKAYVNEERELGQKEDSSRPPPSIKQTDTKGQRYISQKTKSITYSYFDKILITCIVSSFCMVSSLSNRAYFPALLLISENFDVTISFVNLTVTVYAIFQGFAPSFWGPISDRWGRRPTYLVSFLISIASCLILATVKTFWGLLILRMLQSFGESSSIALGFGTIGDITTAAERASYSHIIGSTLTISMATGPALGGFIAYQLSWRWIFWLLFLLGIIVWIMIYFFLPETLRSIVDSNGASPLSSSTTSPSSNCQFKIRRKKPCYLKEQLSFLRYSDFNLIMIINSCFTVITALLMTTTATHYAVIYHLNVFQVGLCYIPFAAGCTLGSYLIGKLLNYHFKNTALTYGMCKEEIKKLHEVPIDFPIYRARLYVLSVVIAFDQFVMIFYGWTLSENYHLAIPLFLQFLIGLSVGPVLNACHTLLIDLFPTRGASVIAAGNLVTSFFRASATGTIEIAITHVGLGWSFTITGLITTISIIIIPILIKYGQKWRKIRKEQQEERQLLLQTGGDE